MKNWNRRLPAKIIFFIVCITSLTITVASVIGAIAFWESDFYSHSNESILEECVYNFFYSDSYEIVFEAIEQKSKNHAEIPTPSARFSTDNTNLRFQVFDPEGNTILQNTEETLMENSDLWKYFYSYKIDTPEITDESFDIEELGRTDYSNTENVYVVRAYLEDGMPVTDDYALFIKLGNLACSLRYAIYPIGITALFFSVFCFIMLLCVSGRKPNSDDLYPGPLNWIPLDLLLTLAIGGFAICACLIDEFFFWWNDIAYIISCIILAIFTANILLGLCISIAARIKQRTLLTNTVIWRGCKLLWKLLQWLGKTGKRIGAGMAHLFSGIPLIWRTLVIVSGVTFLEFIIILCCWWETDVLLCFWILEKVIVIPLTIYGALFMRKLQKGGQALASGDLNYHIDTKIMFWDFKRHGENLNNIAAGMATAVEERLQSERMKTELITNVSHDIKTPLTSIINYAGLIEKEPCNSEKHKEYAQVLVKKSEHLKHLLDDLVEVSKAATGNLEINLAPCEAGVLLTQAAGEFEQRCQAASLELITSQPEKRIRIMADGRRIWRVFENLLNNACKYSLPGSRVYLSLEEVGKTAVFTFRNTSRTPLNITPSELMERFVRGDASRSTEGNGLGLSIARSLTELQNGEMDITIDGDLFKVTLKFPVI